MADASGTVGGNWGLGDFTNKNSGDDYGYNVNGNMVVYLNEKMTGTPGINQTDSAIIYNHLNLPWKIEVEGGNKGMTAGGVPKTMFRPNDGINYWLAQ